ncbi:unnamed protein product [Arabidopsis thaliana]|uniref:Uncharacterized protein n=2 Tax=Arabidopsis thaliana TaxID=3702 RepID=A0A654EF68_ARATH|nr:uncharacterized protein AT1G28005 [Arabidopsis thaliana]ANM58643.1 hypothetical protein AT1G28005 [Arabidopsis thaliana]CAA0249127.1 unnamed protein product [Arabidopsis thaliana]VYS47368.1 unnamed protein product [Arabidopsis thaliana]|eukprot:NP_001321063.1 hypothetical protein AT1G28005 [Arabidopsis thaliana]
MSLERREASCFAPASQYIIINTLFAESFDFVSTTSSVLRNISTAFLLEPPFKYAFAMLIPVCHANENRGSSTSNPIRNISIASTSGMLLKNFSASFNPVLISTRQSLDAKSSVLRSKIPRLVIHSET